RQQVWEYYQYPLQQVEDRVRQTLDSQGNLIANIGKYILNGGGKRIRPLLAIIASNLDGERNFREAAILIASAVELIHTASLLHDDVIDDAVKRRNKDSARIIWGNKASVLVGDHLYAQGVSIAESLRDHAINDIFLEACRLMTEGETLQLTYHRNLDLTEEIYFRIIKYKTAALISATCRLSAIVAKMEPEKQETLARFGLQLGLAYQIVDDTLDYTGNSQLLGKSICKDLRDGEITLPLLHTLSRCGKREKKKVEEILRMDKPSDKDLQQVLNLMNRYKSIEYSINKAHESVKAAKDNLFSYPDSIHRQALLLLAEYAVSRDQ
ncbi:MAG: polyprenyl synthetase family protein, partial [Nitrospirae bacterium]|nr:polyprenyl synthetase family protein [Nitrospirota bacterium]